MKARSILNSLLFSIHDQDFKFDYKSSLSIFKQKKYYYLCLSHVCVLNDKILFVNSQFHILGLYMQMNREHNPIYF